MADPTLILTDPQGHDLQAVSDVVLDLAYGDDENDFTLIVRDSIDMTRFTRGSRVYLDGTEYGGIVDTVSSSVTTSGSVVQYSGRTWQGLLAHKILSPDTGQDYLTVSGSVSSVLTSLFSRIKLDSVFVAQPDARLISYQFERFTDAWTGLRKMAKASSLKPHMSYTQGQVQVSLLPVKTYEDVVDSDLLDFTATKNYRPVNHLIGLGTGELKNRAVSHWYANAAGEISETQSLFGLDEVVEIYDYSNAEAEELKEETRKKLEELQSEGTIEVTLHDSDVTLDLGDNVAARDNTTGLTVTSEVSKKIIKIEDGVLSVNYEVGDESTSQSLSGSSEASGGGAAYTAGAGITISSHVISADVTQADLDAVSTVANEANKTASDMSDSVGAILQSDSEQTTAIVKAQSTADTAVSQVSTLSQDLTGFENTVSSTYATKSALDSTNRNVSNAQTAANLALANAQELVVNGGFETGDLTGWKTLNTTGMGVTAVANETHSGNYMLSGNLPTSPYAIEFLSKSFPVVQGRILRCSGWFWNDARAIAANISIQFNDVSRSDQADINSAGDGWQYFSVDVTVPSGVSSGRFRLAYFHTDDNPVFVRSDDLSVKDITEVAAAQSTADTAQTSASTAQTAADNANDLASTAQATADNALANAQELVVNGGTDGTLDGWTIAKSSVTVSSDGIINFTAKPDFGSWRMFLKQHEIANRIGIKAYPRTIRISYDAKTTTPTSIRSFYVSVLSKHDAYKQVKAFNSDTWTHVQYDFVFPANAVSQGLIFVTDGSTDTIDATISIRNISVKDITEVAAAQSTADKGVAAAATAQSTADAATTLAKQGVSDAATAQDTADSAISTASSAVQSISAASPLTASRSGNIITLSVPAATPTTAGSMNAADKAKLDGIAEGSNNYALPAATTSTLGGVKPDGKTITVAADGTLTAHSDSEAASFLAAYPVGSIYHTSRSTNPGYVWGGTWRSLPSQGGYLWERLT